MNFETHDKKLLSLKGKIIHQVWFGVIPNKKEAAIEYKKLEKYKNSWIEKNPTWTRIEWDGDMCYELVKAHYSEYLDMYNNYKYPIQQCDAVRNCILHRYGGLYADMDYYCNKPFDLVLEKYKNNIYLVQTPNMPGDHVSNSLMYSEPGHLFWLDVLATMKTKKTMPMYFTRHLEIMYTTGPGILNSVYHKNKIRRNVKSWPHAKFQPYGQQDDIMTLKLPHVYAIHASRGCWHSKDSEVTVMVSRDISIILFVICVLVGVNLFYYFLQRRKGGKGAVQSIVENKE